MPPFTELWLSGGEPMLRREVTDITHPFYVNNGIRWVNLPTKGLLPERTTGWVKPNLRENPELHLHLNVATDGLYEMQVSIRAVPRQFPRGPGNTGGGSALPAEPLQLAGEHQRRHLRGEFPPRAGDRRLRQDPLPGGRPILQHHPRQRQGDGNETNPDRAVAGDLQGIAENLPVLCSHGAAAPGAHQAEDRRGLLPEALALRNRVQLENIESPHPGPMPRSAGETAIVIDYNGDVRACELRGKLANLRDFGCDFEKFWEIHTRQTKLAAIVRDQCWCPHVCFIHDSLRHSPKVLLLEIPVTHLEAPFVNGRAIASSKPLALPVGRKLPPKPRDSGERRPYDVPFSAKQDLPRARIGGRGPPDARVEVDQEGCGRDSRFAAILPSDFASPTSPVPVRALNNSSRASSTRVLPPCTR